MSISIGVLGAGNGQPAAGGKVQNAISKTVDTVAKSVQVPKHVPDVKDVELEKPSVKLVQQSLDDINKVMAGFSISVQFKIDPDYKELIVKVVDQDTGKLIRQIPTVEVVKMSKAMDNLKGLLFAQSA